MGALTPQKRASIRAAAIEMDRRKPKVRVIDKLLYALRKRPGAYRCHSEDPHKWLATCPECGDELGIAEQPWGQWKVLLFCAGGCDDPAILAALAADTGDSEHLAALAAQDAIALDEYARRDRARQARREIKTWQSTTTSSPSTDSTTTAVPPKEPPRATASSPSGAPTKATTRPGSLSGSTSSGQPSTPSSPASGSASTETPP